VRGLCQRCGYQVRRQWLSELLIYVLEASIENDRAGTTDGKWLQRLQYAFSSVDYVCF
jgi:hypothetical protein